jgi:hypothetical protein
MCRILFGTAAGVAVNVPCYLQQVFGSSAVQQQQLLVQQLYALQVTRLKTGLWALNALQQQQEKSLLHCMTVTADTASSAGDVIDTCNAVLSHCTGGAGNYSNAIGSSSSNSRGSSRGGRLVTFPAAAAAAAAAARAPWVALMARSLFVIAEALKLTAAAAEPADTAATLDNGATLDLVQLTKIHAAAACECLKMLSRFLGAAGLPAEVLQQLQLQQAEVEEQLSSLQDKQAAAPDSSSAHQLQTFAQVVMGRIALSSACNNPGCVNLAQRSELLLVGGKSYSRCARCKAVRCAAAQEVELYYISSNKRVARLVLTSKRHRSVCCKNRYCQ